MGEATTAGRSLADVLPDYELLGELGRGAMGVVFAARHRTLGRVVAVKELPAAFAADDGVRQRFVREGRTLASLDHPHVVVVHDFVDRDGHLALIMERLPGGSLWDQFTTLGVGPSEACGFLLSVAAGLDHAHRHEVLHRDVKPENLLFTAERQLKVTDFGMAKVMGGDKTLATADGVVVGTPAYMAPEQAEGAAIGPQADVYACGTLLYELLSGRLPFNEAASSVAMLVARVRDDAPPLREVTPEVPPSVAAVVDNALARDPAHRYAGVEEFGVELGRAAASAWGPDFLDEVGVVVTGSSAIERASRTSMEAPGWSGTEGPTAGWGPAPRTVIDLRGEPDGALPAVRASSVARFPAVDLAELRPSDLVDVAQAEWSTDPGRSRSRPGSVALGAWLALAGLMGVISVVAIASALVVAQGQRPLASPLQINGEAVTAEPVSVALHRPLTIDGIGPGTKARLEVSFAGLPLGVEEAPLNGGRAVFEPEYLEWTTAGVVDLAVRPVGAAEPAATVRVAPTHRWWLNAPALAVAVVGAFGLAYLTGNWKGLRRPRGPLFGPALGLGLSTAVTTGAVTAGLVLLFQAVPTPGSVAIGMASAASAAVAAGLAVRTRRRLRGTRRR